MDHLLSGNDYDIKWLNSLKKRILNGLDDREKERILQNAKEDIANILGVMYPAKEDLVLYRTAWIDDKIKAKNECAYSRDYKTQPLVCGGVFEIKTLSSYSRTPCRENADVGSDFYRYELRISAGMPILKLDQFVTHNEEGEVLLPPMRCKVIGMRSSQIPKCGGIFDLVHIDSL